MSRADELSKIDRGIKDAESRLNRLQASLEALDQEIDNLTSLENTIRDNIACLKRNKIIAVAQEFKKSKEELKKVVTRMTVLQNDKVHFEKQIREVESFLTEARKEHEKLQSQDENNVLNFNLEKK